MKITLNKNYLLSFFGLIVTIYILWNRFRIKFPRYLPLFLIDYQVVFLKFTCISLCISLIITIMTFTKFNSYIKTSPISIEVQHLFKESLCQFDFLFRSFVFPIKIKNMHYKLLLHLFTNPQLQIIFAISNIIKIIPPIILIIDIFYFNHIKFFYISLTTLIIPMLCQYFYYSLHLRYVLDLEVIEKILDVYTEEHDETTNYYKIENNAIHYFLQETTLKRLRKRENIPLFHVALSENFINNNPNADLEKIFSYYYVKVLSRYSEYYEVLHNINTLATKYNSIINLISLTILSSCWIYIDFTSHKSFTQLFVTFWLDIIRSII
jgi:hypothetical protein